MPEAPLTSVQETYSIVSPAPSRSTSVQVWETRANARSPARCCLRNDRKPPRQCTVSTVPKDERGYPKLSKARFGTSDAPTSQGKSSIVYLVPHQYKARLDPQP